VFIGGGVFGGNILPKEVMEKRPECYEGKWSAAELRVPWKKGGEKKTVRVAN
jgi:hypothetical protein